MSAFLDTQKSYGDRSGGTSDPRLVRQLDNLGPVIPSTDEEIAAIKRLIAHRHAGDERTARELLSMILPEDRFGQYVLEMKDAA